MRHGTKILLALTLLAASVSASAGAPSLLFDGVPTVKDVSLSPNWHVYVQAWHGVNYIRIDDAQHVTRLGIAASKGTNPTIMVLPIGRDAEQAQVDQAPSTGPGSDVIAVSHTAAGWQVQSGAQPQAIPLCNGDAGECSGIRALNAAPYSHATDQVSVFCSGDAGRCSTMSL